MGCHALLQGIFPTQGSNPHLAGRFFTASDSWEEPWWRSRAERKVFPKVEGGGEEGDREDREEKSPRDHKGRELRDRKKDRFNSDAADKYRKKDEEESESEGSDDSAEEVVVERELRRTRTPKEEAPAEEPETEEVAESQT